MYRSRSGLCEGTLSQWEAIAQSLANIAPTATPAMGIPFILALSGSGSWLACLIALLGIVCVAHQINLFARRSSSSGSLYCFVEESLGPASSLVTAYALLIAYICTGCAVIGGFTIYCYSFTGSHLVPSTIATVLLTIFCVTLAAILAYRDVHVSARVMLSVEAVSILLILALFLVPGRSAALHWDKAQFQLAGSSLHQMRSGLILAIFGFVGFESAASLGSEAVNPLVTIPRAIMSTAWISGVFFVLAAYAETIGFAGHETQLAQSEAPLQLLAELRHLPFLAPLITLTTVCSFFACALACITAAARILYKLSCDDHVHRFCRSVHPQHRTPHVAIFCVSTSMLVIIVLMTSFHVLPFDVYGWAGTFATYGFITAYFMVSAGSIVILSRTHAFTPVALFSLAGSFSILTLAAAGSFEESSGPYHWLPYIYIALIAGVVQLVLLRQRRRSGRMPSAPAEGTELSPGLQSD